MEKRVGELGFDASLFINSGLHGFSIPEMCLYDQIRKQIPTEYNPETLELVSESFNTSYEELLSDYVFSYPVSRRTLVRHIRKMFKTGLLIKGHVRSHLELSLGPTGRIVELGRFGASKKRVKKEIGVLTDALVLSETKQQKVILELSKIPPKKLLTEFVFDMVAKSLNLSFRNVQHVYTSFRHLIEITREQNAAHEKCKEDLRLLKIKFERAFNEKRPPRPTKEDGRLCDESSMAAMKKLGLIFKSENINVPLR